MRRWRRNCSGPSRPTTPTWEMRTRAEALGPGDAARIDLALLLLRVILAAVFGSYGYLKWAGGVGGVAVSNGGRLAGRPGGVDVGVSSARPGGRARRPT